MNSLAQPTVAAVLTRLFDEAASTEHAFRARAGALTDADRSAMLATAQTDYRAFYHQVKDVHLAVSRETATLLYMLGRSTHARSIVEFGTSFGLSTVHLAAALRDNGGGRLITTEFEPEKAAIAAANLRAAGLADLVDIREGDAIETLATNLPERIDLVLLDGAKVLYPGVLALLEPRLADGAIVLADNADHNPAYVAHVRGDAGYLSVPFTSEVELSVRVRS